MTTSKKLYWEEMVVPLFIFRRCLKRFLAKVQMRCVFNLSKIECRFLLSLKRKVTIQKYDSSYSRTTLLKSMEYDRTLTKLLISFSFFLLLGLNLNGASLLFNQGIKSFTTQDSLPHKSYPENRKVIPHGVEDGLSQGTAYSILKDSRGFMWFTSYEGLNRFNGHQFKVYSESPRDNNSLKGSQTFGLVEDPFGNIWTGTDACLNRYLRQSDQFDFVFAQNNKGESISSVNYPFFADSSEVWYINSEEGIQVYDFLKKQKRVISATFLYGQSSHIINSTLRTQDGMIWFRDEIGLACIDPDSGNYKWYFSNKEDNVLGEAMKLVCFYQDDDGVIWLGYRNGVIRFDYKSGQYKKINLDEYISNSVDDIKKDRDGFYWLGTEQDGLLCYSESLGVIDHFQAKGTGRNRLSSNAIITVYTDDQNLVWVSTDPEGVDVLIPDLKPFKKYGSDFFDPTVFSTLGVRAFLEKADGNILIGTQEDGLVEFDRETDRIIRRFDPGESGFVPNSATCFLEDNQGSIWVGTYDGLYLLEKGGKHFQKIVNQARPERMVPSNFISHLITLPDSTVVIGSEEGIYFIPPKQLEPIAIDTLNNIISGRFHLTDKGYLLVSENNNGFYALKVSDWINTNNTTKGKKQGFIKHYFPQFNIKHFYQIDNDSILWLASNTGLIKAKHNEDWSDLELIKHYTRDNGLSSNYIYGILPDKNGKLWMSTNRGISCFDPIDENVINYSIEDGLQGFEFNTNSFLKTSDGEFYFGGTGGFNRFYPEFKENKITPRLQITGFQVNDKAFNIDHYIGEQEEVYLSSEENTFSIQFSAIDYQSNGNNKYRAKLENYDNAWTELGHNNSIRYTKVAPGDYLFKVIAANNDGLWASQVKTLHIHISTPLYQTWWAYLAYFTAAIFILFQIYQVRIRRRILKEQLLFEQKGADRLKELDSFKTRFYSNITHEFRTPLTVIEGMADELKNNPGKQVEKKLSLIIKNSKNLLALVNQMLDLSKLKAGKITTALQQDDIIIFVKYLVETNESFARLQNVGLQFYSDEKELLMDFDSKKIQQVLTNLISNAVKFTPEYGKVLVVAKKVNQNNQALLEILVKDNGIGISTEQLPYIFDRFHQANPIHNNQGTGIGLALVKELMTIMGASISVESELDKGTTFSLLFPIQNKAALVSQAEGYEFKPIAHEQDFVTEEAPNSNNELPILLIIEDNADVSYYIQTCLQNQYQILTSNNGKKGIEKAFETLPDIIISDVMMPVMDGFEVCATLKDDERTSHIPIILLTAKATSEDKLTGLTHGADAYLLKPFEKEELIIRLNKLLEIRKTLQKKYSSTLISSQTHNYVLENKEDSFIEKTEKIILSHLEEEDFSIHELARELHLSRSQVHRKIKALTGMSAAIYIRHLRLQIAKGLLTSTQLSISEIAYQVGFKTPVYFSQVFKETFGESPNATRK